MSEISVTVLNESGLHARPAGMLVKTASTFQSDIELKFGDGQVNAKSIMSIMGLGIPEGAQVKFSAEGADAVEALSAIEKLFANKFEN